MLGFMSMLIALIAKQHARGRIDSDRLGLTQVEAFTRITGVVDDRIGEQICFLSATGDERFLGGCRNALLFLKAYYGEHDSADADVGVVCEALTLSGLGLADTPKDETPVFGRGGLIAAALWQHYFDRHLG